MKKSNEQGAVYDENEDGKDSENKKIFSSPYKKSEKVFTESGNLKAHIRTHVSSLTRIDWRTSFLLHPS
jgi:hypothetical protein